VTLFGEQASGYDFTFDPYDTQNTYSWLLKLTEGFNTILEIGCATGRFGHQLISRGATVVGVERDVDAAESARKRGVNVIVGDVEEASVRGQVSGQFDVIVMADVLEHLHAPGALLRYARQVWLCPGGSVVISVPNAGHWVFRREVLRGRFPYRQYGLFDQTHLRFFTHTSLTELVTTAGYQLQEAAHTVSHNSRDDLTFAILAPFYRWPSTRRFLQWFERFLASHWSTLFAYQFVWRIVPLSTD